MRKQSHAQGRRLTRKAPRYCDCDEVSVCACCWGGGSLDAVTRPYSQAKADAAVAAIRPHPSKSPISFARMSASVTFPSAANLAPNRMSA
jgi:hypothetical protein